MSMHYTFKLLRFALFFSRIISAFRDGAKSCDLRPQNISVCLMDFVFFDFDGAPVMSTCVGRLLAKIKGKYYEEIIAHCYSHVLNFHL